MAKKKIVEETEINPVETDAVNEQTEEPIVESVFCGDDEVLLGLYNNSCAGTRWTLQQLCDLSGLNEQQVQAAWKRLNRDGKIQSEDYVKPLV